VLVSFDVVAVVRSSVRATRTLNHVRRFDLGLPSREIGEQNFLLLTVFAGETEIPLAGGKGAHAFRSSISSTDNGREERGVLCGCSYKA